MITITENVDIEEFDAASGKLLSVQHVHNKVTVNGQLWLMNLIAGTSTYLHYFAIGTSATAPTAADTTLTAEVFRDQVTQYVTSSANNSGTAVGTLVVKYYLGTGSANGVTLQEAGVLDAASSGNLFSHVTYTGIAKTSSNTITYTWTFTFTGD